MRTLHIKFSKDNSLQKSLPFIGLVRLVKCVDSVCVCDVKTTVTFC